MKFIGNGYTSGGRAVDYAYLRSAELTLEKEKKYFVVRDNEYITNNNIYWTGVGYHFSSSSSPTHELIIEIYDENLDKTELGDSVLHDALQIVREYKDIKALQNIKKNRKAV